MDRFLVSLPVPPPHVSFSMSRVSSLQTQSDHRGEAGSAGDRGGGNSPRCLYRWAPGRKESLHGAAMVRDGPFGSISLWEKGRYVSFPSFTILPFIHIFLSQRKSWFNSSFNLMFPWLLFVPFSLLCFPGNTFSFISLSQTSRIFSK